MTGKGEILERQGIFVAPRRSVGAFVGQTAGLGAESAVAASSSYEGGEQALTRVADAESAGNKDLDLHATVSDRCLKVGA